MATECSELRVSKAEARVLQLIQHNTAGPLPSVTELTLRGTTRQPGRSRASRLIGDVSVGERIGGAGVRALATALSHMAQLCTLNLVGALSVLQVDERKGAPRKRQLMERMGHAD